MIFYDVPGYLAMKNNISGKRCADAQMHLCKGKTSILKKYGTFGDTCDALR
jgi:hypothetical protein